MRFRSQVEAPIELWIAVIILTASMAMAFFVMSQTNEAKCVAEIRSQVRELKSAMMDVAIGSPPTSREVYFRMPVCAGISTEGLRFTYYTNPQYCTSCPGKYGSCWKIEPIIYDPKSMRYRTSDTQECVEMSGDVGLVDQGNCIPLYNLEDVPHLRCPTGKTDANGNCQSDWIYRLGVGGSSTNVGSALALAKDPAVDMYRIRLTKTLGPATGGGEKGLITVCVEKIK